jgi:hypothetical protein
MARRDPDTPRQPCEYFADGIVEDIITALSRMRWLFVIARNSSFTYKGRAVDVKQVGRELGVRYVLEGSVRKAADRVRITGQLIDTPTGQQRAVRASGRSEKSPCPGSASRSRIAHFQPQISGRAVSTRGLCQVHPGLAIGGAAGATQPLSLTNTASPRHRSCRSAG